MSVSDKLLEFMKNAEKGEFDAMQTEKEKYADVKQTSMTEVPFLVEADSMRAPETLSPGEARVSKPDLDTIEPLSLPVHTPTSVYLSYGKSPSHFYLHLADSSQLEKLNDLMQTTYAKKTPSEEQQDDSETLSNESHHTLELEPGSLCASFSLEDQSWYRAKIVSVEGDHAMVDYIDYGSNENIPIRDLKVLEKDLMLISAQAAFCYLSDAVLPSREKPGKVCTDGESDMSDAETNADWSTDVIETFLAEAGMQRELTATAQSEVNPLTGKQAVCLSYDEVSIAKMLNAVSAETTLALEPPKAG